MTNSKIKILITIPVYNHAETLRNVVERALAVHEHVLVVDDGSTDGGADSLSDLPVTVVRHESNRGKGEAVQTAARQARAMGFTHIVVMDADGQHDPADFERFAPLIRKNPWAIIVGKRDFTAADVPGGSRFGRSFSNFWLRLQTGCSLGDAQSGFRAYPLSLLEGLMLNEKGYAFEIEALVKAAWAGAKLLDVDVSVYYPPKGERVSHFDKFWDNLRLTALNAKLTLRSIAPVPHRRLVPDENGEKLVSVLHPLKSVKRLLSDNMSPGKLAAAVGVGVFLGALPLIACHTIAIILAAGFLRLNKAAAIAASQLCMPPWGPAVCVEAGFYLRNGRFLTDLTFETIGRQALDRLFEWLIGSLVVGPLAAASVAGAVYFLALNAAAASPSKIKDAPD